MQTSLPSRKRFSAVPATSTGSSPQDRSTIISFYILMGTLVVGLIYFAFLLIAI